jgi:flagellar motility protein MotE (MotC chaperone)
MIFRQYDMDTRDSHSNRHGGWSGGFLLRLLIGIGVAKLVLGVLFFANTGLNGSLAGATDSSLSGYEAAGETTALRAPSQVATACEIETMELLRVRLREVDDRQAVLERQAKDLELLKSEIEDRIRELKDLQSRLEGPAKGAKDDYQARFEHLVGVYSSMEPASAAALLDKLEDMTVVKIFAAMKSKKVAMILALIDAEKAARISSALSRMKLPGDTRS